MEAKNCFFTELLVCGSAELENRILRNRLIYWFTVLLLYWFIDLLIYRDIVLGKQIHITLTKHFSYSLLLYISNGTLL